jgi:hypothetical protein
MLFGFVREFSFPFLPGSFVDFKNAFKVRTFDFEAPVAETPGRNSDDAIEIVVGVVGEFSVFSSSHENAVPEGIIVGLIKGVACFDVGMALEVMVEGFPGRLTVGVEKCLRFGSEGFIVESR